MIFDGPWNWATYEASRLNIGQTRFRWLKVQVMDVASCDLQRLDCQ